MADESGFSGPLKAELPIRDQEAFRLASFGINYVPQYAEVRSDRHCDTARWFYLSGDTWTHTGRYAANLSAFKRFYAEP